MTARPGPNAFPCAIPARPSWHKAGIGSGKLREVGILGAWKEIDRSCRQEGHRDNGCNTSTVVSEPGEDKLVEEFFMLHAGGDTVVLGHSSKRFAVEAEEATIFLNR